MATKIKDGNTKNVVKDDLFSQGWLDRHIDTVVAEIARRPQSQRPQLIGPRAEAMRRYYLEVSDF